MPTITLPVGGVPKGQIVRRALKVWGVRQDREPSEVVDALDNLNAMMAEPPFNLLPYERPNYGSGSLEDLSGIDPQYEQAVMLSLAKLCAPNEGAQLPGNSEAALARSMASLRADLATVPTMKLGTFVAGAGNRYRPPYIVDA